MPVLTQQQIDGYHENGFLVVEDLVSPEDIQRLKDDTLKICRGEYPCETIQPLPATMSDQEVLENFLCIHQPHKISPLVLEMVKHPGMAGVLSQIIAPDVKCMQSMLFVKPPDFPGQAWHQDELYIPTRDRSLTGGWIAMDDATVENGCLWVLPGSHKKGYLYDQHSIEGMEDEWDFANCSYGFDDSGKIPVEVKAGAVVFFNGYLLHTSFKNRSNMYRRVLVNHYMNAYSLLNWAGEADYRDVVMVAGEDPYAHKGYKHHPGIWLRTCKKLVDKQEAESTAVPTAQT